MADDRFTGIDADQIQDNTLTPDEFKSSNTPAHFQPLIWDNVNQIMKWQHLFGNRIIQ